MPELPEVTTTVNGLQGVLPRLAILSVWTDLAKKNQPIKQFKETLKSEKFFKKFKRQVVGARVLNVERRAKNILINLSNKKTILIHLRMTGHILYGKYTYDKKENMWRPSQGERKSLFDPYNRFIHVVFSLSNGKHFVFCDSRKFGKVTTLDTGEAHETIHLKNIGPEPLDKNFKLKDFIERLFKKPTRYIKTVLMDQGVVAGIGNIYSDEMLWLSGIHPESQSKFISKEKLSTLFLAMKQVLKQGIDFGGDSMSDYRDITGGRGRFQNKHNVYGKKNEPCGKAGCHGVIIRKVLNGRSAHFCNKHQKLFNGKKNSKK